MNADWIDFLTLKNATLMENSEIVFHDCVQDADNSIIAISHLATIKVSGKDAEQFLQGQLTCNIKDITETTSFFAAFCNHKGRAISTFLILKKAESFLIIVPTELLETVINKLKMYILRSDVQLNNVSDSLCLIGLNSASSDLLSPLPKTQFEVCNATEIIIKFPSNNNRYLIICSVARAKTLWTQLTKNSEITSCNTAIWQYQDISAGICWLSKSTSEQYIPQMLNIDKFGGISFSKGCYTGQEIIARTHYLGKAKRELFLAECDKNSVIDDSTRISSNDKELAIGKIISFQKNNHHYRLLLVLPTTDAGLLDLKLNNPNQDKIKLIDFQ